MTLSNIIINTHLVSDTSVMKMGIKMKMPPLDNPTKMRDT